MRNSTLKLPGIIRLAALAVGVSLSFAPTQNILASENVPHSPFGDWASIPPPGQLIAGAFYDESESYHIYANGNHRYDIDTPSGGEHYGIDINQGWLFFQYGINQHWAADLAVGYTTSGWRAFSNGGKPGSIRSTTGLMDSSLGVRYQIFNEDDTNNPSWVPTLTFRAGHPLGGDRTGVHPQKTFRLARSGNVWRRALPLEPHDGQRSIHRHGRTFPADQRLGIGRGLPPFASHRRHGLDL